jgi:hypothetical protein
MVTAVPPLVKPEEGEIEETVGAGFWANKTGHSKHKDTTTTKLRTDRNPPARENTNTFKYS